MKSVIKIKWVEKDVLGFQKGLTLIELLIFVSVGMLLFFSILKIYLGSQQSIILQNDLYTIQENAQTAISILNHNLHQAGHIGCAKLSADFRVIPYSSYALNIKNKLFSTTQNEVTVNYAGYPNTTLTQPMQVKVLLYVGDDIHFSPGEVMFISNCIHAEVFVAAKVIHEEGKQRIIPAAPLHDLYGLDAEVSPLISNRFFIAKSGRQYANGRDIYSLFLQDIKFKKIELVPGIQRMNISYTILQNGIFKEVSWTEIKDWSAVVGVAIDLDVDAPSIQKTWHLYAALI